VLARDDDGVSVLERQKDLRCSAQVGVPRLGVGKTGRHLAQDDIK
jgi:hypothetical protein